MSANAENPQLLTAAAAVADGSPVDWDTLQRESDPEQSTILDELRMLRRLNQLNADTPAEWGPFSVIREIGRGVFGRVYHAFDPTLRIDIALKVVGPGTARAPIDLDRALNEARLLARISHPNVVRVFRAERIGDEVGIAMELVKGRTLDELVREAPCSANEAMLIGLDLSHALAAVHAAGTLHGDIKARNVMREPGGRIVLMDFGAGRDLHAAPGPGGDFAGTPVYLAPEVFAGIRRTKHSDIYSVGVLLYHLVTGSYPVEGHTTTEIGRRHERRTSRRRLRDARPDLPDGFIRVVERAIAERPEDRYESAGALESALADALAAPVFSRRRAPRRSGLMLAVAAAVLVSATGGAVLYRELTAVPANAPIATTPTPPAPNAASTYRIEAALYVERDGTRVRMQQGMAVEPGDRMSLEIQSSVPAHVYLVNEDEQGEAYLLFPLPGQNLTNPLPAALRHRLPGVQNGQSLSWQVTSAGGQEHFLIFASPERSPAFEQVFAALPPPTLEKPVQAVQLSREAVGVLRGVGGLSTTPTELDQQLRLARDIATPLIDGEETVRGVWIRRLTLENPVR
jgi:hypothetical protein